MEPVKKRGKAGRKKVKDKVKVEWIYLRGSEKKKIVDKFGKLQDAIKDGLLPLCG